jgi:hypothetical protein
MKAYDVSRGEGVLLQCPQISHRNVLKHSNMSREITAPSLSSPAAIGSRCPMGIGGPIHDNSQRRRRQHAVVGQSTGRAGWPPLTSPSSYIPLESAKRLNIADEFVKRPHFPGGTCVLKGRISREFGWISGGGFQGPGHGLGPSLPDCWPGHGLAPVGWVRGVCREKAGKEPRSGACGAGKWNLWPQGL